MSTTNVEGEVVNDLVLNSMCIFLKNQKCPFIPRIATFPELLFYIPKVAFCFPEVSFYLMCVCVFQMVFSQGDCTFYLSCSELLKDDICLALKNSTWSMISDAFYSSFILHDSLKNAVSEDLE